MTKKIIASLLYYTGILYIFFQLRLKTTQIRAINYHCTPSFYVKNFDKHLKFYSKYFTNCDLESLNNFFDYKNNFNKPGLILSFDDGLRSNFDFALPALERNNFTGWFFVPYGFLLDNTLNFVKKNSIIVKQIYLDNRYGLTKEEYKYLQDKHIIGSHTFSHHRFNINDTDECLNHEIMQSRILLNNVDVFCWVGGELNTYTKKAYNKIIESGYKYSFTTNNLPIKFNQDKFNLNRTNIEADYSIPLIMFQLSGLMDIFYFFKRNKIKKFFYTYDTN